MKYLGYVISEESETVRQAQYHNDYEYVEQTFFYVENKKGKRLPGYHWSLQGAKEYILVLRRRYGKSKVKIRGTSK